MTWVLAAATIAAQIAYPLVHGDARDGLTVATVVLFFLASVVHAATSRGARFAVVLVAVTAGGGLLVEAVGTRTGIPFGDYSYAGSLGPTLVDVPAVIPLAWTMMAYPCWVAAGRLVRGPGRVLVAGWALAAWDLFLDPQMVDAGHWTWRDVGVALTGVPDVPVTNYLGWLVTALVMFAVLSVLTAEPASPDDGVPLVLFGWTYLSSVLAHLVFFGLPWSALYGGVAMGLVAVPVLLTLRPASVPR